MSFPVAAVAETHEIVDIQPTFRSFRDGNDVMDFRSRLDDFLCITILADRMIVAIPFRQPPPL